MKINAFFKPESKITHQLIRRINQRRTQAIQQAVKGFPPDVDDSSESDELQRSIIAALEDDIDDPTYDDGPDRRWLSEIVYHFLGRLAHRSRREGPSEFDLAECIVKGMRVRLGLDAAEDVPLLEELAREFSDWLVKLGNAGFVAGWGKIVIDTQDSQKLCFKPLERYASPSYMAQAVNAALTRQAGAGMRGAARLDRDTESSDH